MHKINTEEIKSFLTSAKYLSFSKAAEKLYVSQPAITKWIKHLEKELDMTLFERTNRGIILTPAGKSLYESWSSLAADFNESIDTARALDPTANSKIRIGILRGLDHDKYLLQGVKEFQQLHPDISFDIQVYDFYEMKANAKELDLILTTTLETGYLSDSEQLITERMNIYIAMSDQNPLADKEPLHLLDLKSERFIMFSAETMSSATDNLTDAFKALGIVPDIIPVDNIPSQRIFVKLNQGIAIGNHRFLQDDDGIVLKKCVDFDVEIYRLLMYNKKSRNKIAHDFFQILTK